MRVIAFVFLLCGSVSSNCLAQQNSGTEAAIELLELMLDLSPEGAVGPMDAIREKIRQESLAESELLPIRERLSPLITPLISEFDGSSLDRAALLLAGELKLKAALSLLTELALDAEQPSKDRGKCVVAVSMFGKKAVMPVIAKLLSVADRPIEIDESIVDALVSLNDSAALLDLFPRVAGRAKPRIVDALAGNKRSAALLLDALEAQRIPKTAVGPNQAARILAHNDQPLTDKLTSVWGTVRTDRDPRRAEVIKKIEKTLRTATGGDADRGLVVFRRVCAQCHRLHGDGHDVGPEITRNGRGNFAQLLSNVFDPNLVIGTGFVSRSILTLDGRALSGVVTEETEDRIVLKVQGGKLETIDRDDIDVEKKTGLSLMPEGLETQLSEKELIDLFALLTLESAPSEPNNRLISGTPTSLHR